MDVFWEGHDITPASPQYLNLRPCIVQPDVKLETGEGAGGASLAPAGACEIERVLAEWLVVVRCDANDVCLEQVLLEIERL